jgi:Ion channel
VAPPRTGINLLLPLSVGAATTFCTIFIHALALKTIVHFVRRERRLGRAGVIFWKDVTIVAGVTSLALAAHLVEIATWALVFELCGEFPDFAAAFYHSAENYTTLGYGDVACRRRGDCWDR